MSRTVNAPGLTSLKQTFDDLADAARD